MRNKTKLTVGLFEGEKQTIEAAAWALGVSMSEFARYFAYEAAQKVLTEQRKKNQLPQVIDGEFVGEDAPVSQVRQMPWLPDLPDQDDFAKAENAFQTRIKSRSVTRG